jgi:simple sugar transport system permease protein
MTESTLKKSRTAWRIKLEPRLDEPPAWYPAAVSLGAIVVALILGGIIIALVGGNPFLSYIHIAKASFGDVGVLSDTIVKATPIILAALACSIAFRMKLWNIGAEGQFIMGAFGASAIVLAPVLPTETSRWLFIPVMAMAGMAAGAIWGFIPGYLKAKFNVNEIISTLMMNSFLSRADHACRFVIGHCRSGRLMVHCLSQSLGL